MAACSHAAPDTSTTPAPSVTSTHDASAEAVTRPLFSFHDKAIAESSGIAPSSSSDRLVFTHNDSGDAPRFYAVDLRGCTVARYEVAGASATDWEDMASSRGPNGASTLWFGDIGDNLADRPSVQVYAVPEPTPQVPASGRGRCPAPKEKSVQATRYDLTYPDGPHDAEALMADTVTGRLYLVTKPAGATGRPILYGAPPHLDPGHTNPLRELAVLGLPGRPTPRLVTGADISPDGRFVVVRTYGDAYEWSVTDGDVAAAMSGPPRRIDLPAQPQGESIAYTRSGEGLLVSSEDPLHTSPPVYLVVTGRRG